MILSQAYVEIGFIASSTIQMTGNWTTGQLNIFGSPTSTTEETALVLDTNGSLAMMGIDIGLRWRDRPLRIW